MISEISCEEIRVSPFQPRRVFGEEELEELAASIRAVGLIHPPVVRRIESGGKLHYYELIAGERRWRACQLAGLTTIKVLIRSSSDDEAARATLIENVQRVDLDPIETAHAFKKLLDAFHMTQEEVAERVGKKRSTVANYLRLLALPDDIQAKLSSGTFSMGHAKALLALESEELQEKLAALIFKRKLTVREAERESRKWAKKRSPDPHIEEFEEQLQETFGTKVVLNHRGRNGGTLTIHYYSLDDLEQLALRVKSF